MVSKETLAGAVEGQLLDGRYRLKRLLGAGAFGLVMIADHVLADEVLAEVAVKVLPTGPDHIKEQLEELRQSIRLSHPGLVRFHGVGQSSLQVFKKQTSVLYLAMELGSETLLDRMQRGLLGAQEAHKLAVELLEVLDYLRGQQVVHRDLKPSNVLRVGPRWKLADLGIAQRLEHGATSHGPAIGTLRYMPPEALEQTSSPSWDIWSFGITLMQAITGQMPYSAQNEGEWRYLVKTTDPEVPFGLPEPLDQVVRGCLARDRSLRPTPQQLLAHLRTKSAAFPTSGPGVVLVAPQGGHATSLQDAVRQSQPWTRIYVAPGRYEGEIEFNKPLEIIGFGAAADIIVDGVDRSALTATAAEGLVRGITLRTSAAHAKARGVVEVLSGHVTFDLCEVVSDSVDCFFAYTREARPVVRRTRFVGGRTQGLVFQSDAEGLVEHCQVIRSPRAAIAISDKANPVIRRCTIESPTYRGVFVGENGRGIIEDCSVVGGQAGAVELSRGARTIFRRVDIRAGSGPAVHATSGAKAVFIECEPKAENGREWELSAGHQVQRM